MTENEINQQSKVRSFFASLDLNFFGIDQIIKHHHTQLQATISRKAKPWVGTTLVNYNDEIECRRTLRTAAPSSSFNNMV